MSIHNPKGYTDITEIARPYLETANVSKVFLFPCQDYTCSSVRIGDKCTAFISDYLTECNKTTLKELLKMS